MCPRAPQGGSCPERWGSQELGPGSLAARPLPVGSALQVQELTGRWAGGGGVGRMELPEVRGPCPAQHLPLHAACRGPAVRNRGFTQTCPHVPAFSFLPPSLFCQKDPVRRSLCPLGPRTCGPWPRIRASPLAAGPMSGAPKAKDLGRGGPAALLALLGPVLREADLSSLRVKKV